MRGFSWTNLFTPSNHIVEIVSSPQSKNRSGLNSPIKRKPATHLRFLLCQVPCPSSNKNYMSGFSSVRQPQPYYSQLSLFRIDREKWLQKYGFCLFIVYTVVAVAPP